MLICTLFINYGAYAQQNSSYTDYIRKYHTMATDQMHRHQIPASITLSQAILESGAGQSTLAIKANNHFGIKVGSTWDGPYVLQDDDRPGEKFRKYKSVEESYEDHSQFLKQKRYARLFELEISDYIGWANGLKACGYATSPTYAEKLISLIERYQLYQYDGILPQGHKGGEDFTTERDAFFATHPVRQCNHNYYVILQPGDNLDYVARMTGVKRRKLISYNDLPKNAAPAPGSVIFLQKKRKHADQSMMIQPHVLQAGESLYDVSQLYGIRLKSLYRLNGFNENYAPMPGQLIWVY